MHDTLDLPTITGFETPAAPTPVAIAAAAQALDLDLEKMDLNAIVRSGFQPARDKAAEATKTLTGVVHDLSTQAKVDAAKSLRHRLIGVPLADMRRLTKAVKSRLAGASKVAGEEEEKVEAVFTAADALITPQIEAREAELEAEKAAAAAVKAETARLEAERQQRLEDGITTLAGYVDKAWGKTAVQIGNGIEFVAKIEIDPAHWQEYTERAQQTLAATLKTLHEMHADQLRAEALLAREEQERREQAAEHKRLRALAMHQAAELEALRREKAEREAREREVAEDEARSAMLLTAFNAAVERTSYDDAAAVRDTFCVGGAVPRERYGELAAALDALQPPPITQDAQESGCSPADAPAPGDAPGMCAGSDPEASNGPVTASDEGTVAQEVLRAADPAELWAVHIEGPDDIEAASSREAADARADELNAWAARKHVADDGIVFLAKVVAWPYSTEAHAEDLRKMGYTEGQQPQQVLKAEPATADATDRGTAADASPVGGPMGVGQPAAAGPAVAPDSEMTAAWRLPTISGLVNIGTSAAPWVIFAEPEPDDNLHAQTAAFVALVLTAFDTKFPSHPKPSPAWWAEVRQAGEALRGALAEVV